MMRWIKQLICRHDWIRHGDRYIQHGHYITPKARFVCRKCGKEIYK